MAENKLRIESRKESKGRGGSVFSGLERRLQLETYFEDGFPVKYLPKILFATLLSLIYISNTHYADKATRSIKKMQTEVEDLRADFITLKSEVMFGSKQSEVARRVKSMGLQESMKPPFKVIVEEGEY